MIPGRAGSVCIVLIALIAGGLVVSSRADDTVPVTSGSADPAPSPTPTPEPTPTPTPSPEPPKSEPTARTFAGSIQLDYLLIATERHARKSTFDGATTEISLRITHDFSKHASATVKVCFACHGFEAALGFVELRATDELRVKVGRMIPSFGAFPARHDPANHLTSDKPLPYDMGRMVAREAWNEGILPAPWVDNGIEIAGTRFWAHGRFDYAAFLTSGPKGDVEAVDFDFTMSRSPEQYYVDNNSEPVVGGRLAGTFDLSEHASVAVGASAMGGHYDPAGKLDFAIAGIDAAVTIDTLILRAEYLIRRTEMAPGTDPTRFVKPFDDAYVRKDGFYVEGEMPIGPVTALARWDGLQREGNVLDTSPLSTSSRLLRYTAGLAVRLPSKILLKTSAELYQFNDLDDEVAFHIGLATAF